MPRPQKLFNDLTDLTFESSSSFEEVPLCLSVALLPDISATSFNSWWVSVSPHFRPTSAAAAEILK